VPAEKMGVFMGIFNFFIVIPQLAAVALLALLVNLLGGAPIQAMVIGGACMIVAGRCTLWVAEPRLTPAPAAAA